MSPSFEDTLAGLRGVEGWLSDGQARRLWDRAREVPPGGTIAEIGSYHGRSAIVLASASADDVRVFAIDPHAGNDRGPQQIEGSSDEGDADNRAFRANLERAGVASSVTHVRRRSSDALVEIDGTLDMLYVDGAHRYGPARDDIDRWGARVAPGGTMLVHDAFSSIGVTLAFVRLLFLGRDFVYVGRTRSLAEFRRSERPLGAAERARNAGRLAAQLPWFARNVLLKTVVVLRLPVLPRLLGGRPGEWPY